MIRRVLATLVAIGLCLPALAAVQVAAQDDEALADQVRDALGGRDLRNVTVSVEGTEATLAGRVPHFWAKRQAITRALGVSGIATVDSQLELPEAESDTDIAEAIGRTVNRYPHYTIWDHLTARVDGGKVFLAGWVTPDRDKAVDLFERVAKVEGVQDVESTIRTLPPSQTDRRIRRSIERQLAANVHLDRLAGMRYPPFHIIVQNGVVTLVGYVPGDLERIELQRLVAQTGGVRRVENHLELLR